MKGITARGPNRKKGSGKHESGVEGHEGGLWGVCPTRAPSAAPRCMRRKETCGAALGEVLCHGRLIPSPIQTSFCC